MDVFYSEISRSRTRKTPLGREFFKSLPNSLPRKGLGRQVFSAFLAFCTLAHLSFVHAHACTLIHSGSLYHLKVWEVVHKVIRSLRILDVLRLKKLKKYILGLSREAMRNDADTSPKLLHEECAQFYTKC